ncbi:hypothetical protein N8T08_007937 [Aspergillus melleus]|uniref:Uncharacterized protein n=1 Tax=Aspergillus melleus TaxID=138277 RepID=A0ACC3AX92_9EURO|nr:hypothetical protein N8T08_007937 [Aspergillus melleus]
MRPDSFDTPVAKHTRSYTRKLEQDLRNLQLETPTKKPAGARPQSPIPDMSDDFSILSEPVPSPPSARITPAARVPEDLRRDVLVPTKDEQIVNIALITFLNALTIHFNISKDCNWTSHRKALVAKFEDAQYEARTDGYLDDGKENPYALIEVKPVPRSVNYITAIQMQEGAQMVSWIKNDINAELDKPRVHVSQDRHEIFIIVAEYDSDYVAYLTNRSAEKNPPSMLTMHQLGPWNTQSRSDMEQLGPILLAITLYADSEMRKA